MYYTYTYIYIIDSLETFSDINIGDILIVSQHWNHISKVYQDPIIFFSFFHQFNSHEKFGTTFLNLHSFHGHSKNLYQISPSCGKNLRWFFCDFVSFRIEEKNISYYAIPPCFFITGTIICFSRQELLVKNGIYFEKFQNDSFSP